MCLEKLEKFSPCKVGYSVRSRRWNQVTGELELRALFRSGVIAEVDPITKKVIRLTRSFEVGKSYRAERTWITRPRIHYISGFHVFHKLKDAKRRGEKGYNRSILKVKVFGRKITGIQWSSKVTVTEYITVLEEVS